VGNTRGKVTVGQDSLVIFCFTALCNDRFSPGKVKEFRKPKHKDLLLMLKEDILTRC
jgi:hypothetical protein